MLAPYFDDFQIVIDDESAIGWKPESDFDMVFTTNILDTSVRYQARVLPERHIAISNSIDLMVSGASLEGDLLRHKLPLVKEFWVDTNWAISLLGDFDVAPVRFIPWGLEEFPKRKATRPHSPNLLIPRVATPHYNPELAAHVAMSLNASNPKVEITFLGLANSLKKYVLRGAKDPTRFKFLPTLPEEDFVALLQDAKSVLITPKTDGSSIAMLQSLWLGVPIVSTPTIGASEWLSSISANYPPLASDQMALARAVERSMQEGLDFHEHIRMKKTISEVADLTRNVQRATKDHGSWL